MRQLTYHCTVFRIFIFLNLFLLFTGFQQPGGLVKGSQAPDFSVVTMNGDSIRLSALKGSIVFVDFWASWCLPCRSQNSTLTKIHDKYRLTVRRTGVPLVFISISLDTNKDFWRVAVRKDNLNPRRQVCDSTGWESAIVKEYQIKKIPSSFLIDADGKIIEKDLWDGALSDAIERQFNRLSN